MDDIPFVSKLPEEVEEALVPIVATFTGQPLKRIVVVQSYWRGEDEEAAARQFGITVDEYRARLAEFGAACPEIMAVCRKARAEHMRGGPASPAYVKIHRNGELWK